MSKTPIIPKQIEATEAEPVIASKPLLELTQGRAIAMKFGAHEYTWYFRRILRSDWERFFRSFDTESVMIQGEDTETFEVLTGTIDLARSCVMKVEGYTMPDSGDWRAMLPLGHLRAYGEVLREVRVAQILDTPPMALTELSEISLECIWDGKSKWSGLVHRFNPPTLQQQRKFNRACGTYRVLGNERGNRTIYPARQALMMDFYDELIVDVDDCYRARGEKLLDRASIVREMDASHKVAAIQGLLNAGGAGRIVEPPKGDKGEQ